MAGNSTLSRAILIPLRLVGLMAAAYFIDEYLGIDLGFLGILPRTIKGLGGIITAPLIHGNEVHLVSNIFPFIFLATTLFLFYPKIAPRVFLSCYFFTGILVWVFARQTYHIGASGLIYGLASFLMFYGLFKKDFKSLAISIVIVLLYGSIFYGILPFQQPNVSWESHLMGALVGLLAAIWAGRSQRNA